MKRIKGSNVLRRELREFEKEITESIAIELFRIGRSVSMQELPYVPFNGEVDIYIDAIRLKKGGSIILDTSFNDVNKKRLSDFLSDREISHDLLIDLLDMLKNIDGVTGQKPSVLKVSEQEYISFQDDWDTWLCLCGNEADSDGFYTCDEDGNWIEGFTSSEWDNLYRCQKCGRVIDQRDHKVIGVNLYDRGLRLKKAAMSFRNQQSNRLLWEINQQTAVCFEDVTCELDLYETAVAEFDGVILQLIFPDPENGVLAYKLLLTDITKAETTVYFKNSLG